MITVDDDGRRPGHPGLRHVRWRLAARLVSRFVHLARRDGPGAAAAKAWTFLVASAADSVGRVRRLGRKRIPVSRAAPTYSPDAPSNQALADIFAGAWLSRWPARFEVRAGDRPHFEDERVLWADRVLDGGLRGRSILELGPFEGYNTWQFTELGARSVTAVEASDVNLLKCLVVKEVTGMSARFLRGDFVRFLEATAERFDIVWASGVLYHQAEPLRFLELACRASDCLFLHTHYFDADAIGAYPTIARFFDARHDRVARLAGVDVRLHYRRYREPKGTLFAGGAAETSFWMEREALFDCLRALGMVEIRVATDDPGHPNGPALVLLASRHRVFR